MLTTQQFFTVLQEAYRSGVPRGQEWAVLREYIQCEMLEALNIVPESRDLAFIGGTSLRLLYDLDRFSEDLDFDYFGKAHRSFPTSHVTETLVRRGYTVVFKRKAHEEQGERGGTFIFSHLLHELGLSGHKDHTLKVKFDYTRQTRREAATRLLNRFGFTEQILTLPLGVLCARKAHALVQRKRLQPRDMYDLAWFFSRRIAPDTKTLQRGGIDSHRVLLDHIEKLYASHTQHIAGYERDLTPFLIDPKNIRLIRLLPSLAQSVLS